MSDRVEIHTIVAETASEIDDWAHGLRDPEFIDYLDVWLELDEDEDRILYRGALTIYKSLRRG